MLCPRCIVSGLILRTEGRDLIIGGNYGVQLTTEMTNMPTGAVTENKYSNNVVTG